MSNNEETKPINAGEGHVHAGIPNGHDLPLD